MLEPFFACWSLFLHVGAFFFYMLEPFLHVGSFFAC